MRNIRPALFRGRHFQDHLIVLCVRWYLRYCLTLRDLEAIMAEKGLSVDHATIGRWVLRYAPELHKRIRREIRHPNRSWRICRKWLLSGICWAIVSIFIDCVALQCRLGQRRIGAPLPTARSPKNPQSAILD